MPEELKNGWIAPESNEGRELRLAGDEIALPADAIGVPPLPLTLRPRRLPQMLGLLISLVLTVVGVWMIREGDRVGYLEVLLFGIGVVIFSMSLLPGASYLRLSESGFTFCSLFRAHTCRWSDVEGFGILSLASQTRVGWSFRPGRAPKNRWLRVNRAVADFEAALPDNYGMRVEDLAVLMTVLLHRYAPPEEQKPFRPEFDKYEPS